MKLFKITICDYNAKQIEEFISKYDEETYDDFNKSKDLLNRSDYIKANYTKNPTDIDYWIKNDQSNELPDILLSLKSAKVNKESDITKSGFHPRGKYKHLGIRGQWDVYQPLDALASMDLGVNTGWCTTGRYGHYGEGWNFKPSYDDAREHFDDYASRSIEFYYLLNPSTHFGEYAVAVYPEVCIETNILLDGMLIIYLNAEIYNAADDLDYSKLKEIQKCLPDDVLKIEMVKVKNLGYGVCVNKEGYCYSTNLELKNKITDLTDGDIHYIPSNMFEDHTSLCVLNLPNCTHLGNFAFQRCTSLKTISLPKCDRVSDGAFLGCTSLETISIPNCGLVGDNAFMNCASLKTISLPNCYVVGWYGFGICTSLETVSLPNCRRLCANAFRECTSLKTIRLPNCRDISYGVFEDCASLNRVYLPQRTITKDLIAEYPNIEFIPTDK